MEPDQKGEWLLLFYPAPVKAYGSVWHRNPYGYRIIEHVDTAFALMISSRVNPERNESPIDETIQTYHSR